MLTQVFFKRHVGLHKHCIRISAGRAVLLFRFSVLLCHCCFSSFPAPASLPTGLGRSSLPSPRLFPPPPSPPLIPSREGRAQGLPGRVLPVGQGSASIWRFRSGSDQGFAVGRINWRLSASPPIRV